MLTTKQNVLRRFWYAVIALDDLKDGPKPFRLLGEDIVLFLDKDGKPAALKDRCCHRTAKLSKGWMQRRPDRLRLSRLDLRPHRQARPRAAIPGAAGGAEPVDAGLPLRGALRLRLGRARRAARADPRRRGGARSVVPAHPAVLRGVEHVGVPADGEFVRQRAFRLRAQGHVRPAQPAAAGEIRDQGNRLRLRGRDADHGRQPAGAAPHCRHHRADHQAPHAQQVVHAVLPQARHRISVGAAPHHLQFGDADRRRPHPGRAVALPQRHRSRLLRRRS